MIPLTRTHEVLQSPALSLLHRLPEMQSMKPREADVRLLHVYTVTLCRQCFVIELRNQMIMKVNGTEGYMILHIPLGVLRDYNSLWNKT